MWIYESSTGKMLMPNGKFFLFGFAGHGEGLNNPAQQSVHGVGPLPEGDYKMTGWINHDDHLGYGVIVLEAMDPLTQFGRDGFRIHGWVDVSMYGLTRFLTSSNGCICIGNVPTRSSIWTSGDHILRVVKKIS